MTKVTSEQKSDESSKKKTTPTKPVSLGLGSCGLVEEDDINPQPMDVETPDDSIEQTAAADPSRFDLSNLIKKAELDEVKPLSASRFNTQLKIEVTSCSSTPSAPSTPNNLHLNEKVSVESVHQPSSGVQSTSAVCTNPTQTPTQMHHRVQTLSSSSGSNVPALSSQPIPLEQCENFTFKDPRLQHSSSQDTATPLNNQEYFKTIATKLAASADVLFVVPKFATSDEQQQQQKQKTLKSKLLDGHKLVSSSASNSPSLTSKQTDLPNKANKSIELKKELLQSSSQLSKSSKNNVSSKTKPPKSKSIDDKTEEAATATDEGSDSKLKPSLVSPRTRVSSIKEIGSELNSNSNSDIESAPVPSSCSSPSVSAVSDRRSLEERIKMLDEMMDKQKNKQTSEPVAPGKTFGSLTAALTALNATQPAMKQTKLSKIFDLDEQRLQSAASLVSQTSANTAAAADPARTSLLMSKSSVLNDPYLTSTAACQLAMVVASNKSFIGNAAAMSPSSATKLNSVLNVNNLVKDKFNSSPLFSMPSSKSPTGSHMTAPVMESPKTPKLTSMETTVFNIKQESVVTTPPPPQPVAVVGISTPTSVQIAEKLGLKIKGGSSSTAPLFATNRPVSMESAEENGPATAELASSSTTPSSSALPTTPNINLVKSILKHNLTPPKAAHETVSVVSSQAKTVNTLINCSPSKLLENIKQENVFTAAKLEAASSSSTATSSSMATSSGTPLMNPKIEDFVTNIDHSNLKAAGKPQPASPATPVTPAPQHNISIKSEPTNTFVESIKTDSTIKPAKSAKPKESTEATPIKLPTNNSVSNKTPLANKKLIKKSETPNNTMSSSSKSVSNPASAPSKTVVKSKDSEQVVKQKLNPENTNNTSNKAVSSNTPRQDSTTKSVTKIVKKQTQTGVSSPVSTPCSKTAVVKSEPKEASHSASTEKQTTATPASQSVSKTVVPSKSGNQTSKSSKQPKADLKDLYDSEESDQDVKSSSSATTGSITKEISQTPTASAKTSNLIKKSNTPATVTKSTKPVETTASTNAVTTPKPEKQIEKSIKKQPQQAKQDVPSATKSEAGLVAEDAKPKVVKPSTATAPNKSNDSPKPKLSSSKPTSQKVAAPTVAAKKPAPKTESSIKSSDVKSEEHPVKAIKQDEIVEAEVIIKKEPVLVKKDDEFEMPKAKESIAIAVPKDGPSIRSDLKPSTKLETNQTFEESESENESVASSVMSKSSSRTSQKNKKKHKLKRKHEKKKAFNANIDSNLSLKKGSHLSGSPDTVSNKKSKKNKHSKKYKGKLPSFPFIFV